MNTDCQFHPDVRFRYINPQKYVNSALLEYQLPCRLNKTSALVKIDALNGRLKGIV